MSSGERHLRVVGDHEVPRTIAEFAGREGIDLARTLGDAGLWLWAAEAYGFVVQGDTEADVVRCEPGHYIPVKYAENRRLTKLEDTNDYTEAIVELPIPNELVAVFSVRDEVVDEIDFLDQSPDGVQDYAELGIPFSAPVTVLDDDEYNALMKQPPMPPRPRLKLCKR